MDELVFTWTICSLASVGFVGLALVVSRLCDETDGDHGEFGANADEACGALDAALSRIQGRA